MTVRNRTSKAQIKILNSKCRPYIRLSPCSENISMSVFNLITVSIKIIVVFYMKWYNVHVEVEAAATTTTTAARTTFTTNTATTATRTTITTTTTSSSSSSSSSSSRNSSNSII